MFMGVVRRFHCILVAKVFLLPVFRTLLLEGTDRDPGDEMNELLHGIPKYNYFIACFQEPIISDALTHLTLNDNTKHHSFPKKFFRASLFKLKKECNLFKDMACGN